MISFMFNFLDACLYAFASTDLIVKDFALLALRAPGVETGEAEAAVAPADTAVAGAGAGGSATAAAASSKDAAPTAGASAATAAPVAAVAAAAAAGAAAPAEFYIRVAWYVPPAWCAHVSTRTRCDARFAPRARAATASGSH